MIYRVVYLETRIYRDGIMADTPETACSKIRSMYTKDDVTVDIISVKELV